MTLGSDPDPTRTDLPAGRELGHDPLGRAIVELKREPGHSTGIDQVVRLVEQLESVDPRSVRVIGRLIGRRTRLQQELYRALMQGLVEGWEEVDRAVQAEGGGVAPVDEELQGPRGRRAYSETRFQDSLFGAAQALLNGLEAEGLVTRHGTGMVAALELAELVDWPERR
jgi:hypothetical protein